jgi:hypothetical protein
MEEKLPPNTQPSLNYLLEAHSASDSLSRGGGTVKATPLLLMLWGDFTWFPRGEYATQKRGCTRPGLQD